MKINLLFFLCVTLLLISCRSSKQNLSYFENVEGIQSGTIPSSDFEIKIQPDDELNITVSSVVPEATASYNLPQTNPALRSSLNLTTQMQNQTYVVDKNGDINFPILGKVKVEGLSVTELADLLRKKISVDVEDPHIRVELVNFKVNVLGEVKKPGAIAVSRQKYSVLDAIAESGDLTEFGLRENVLLIRDENGVKKYQRLNLNDINILSSPYFYLQQNDVLYVEPNKIRKDNSKYNQNNAFKISVVSTIVSAVSVIASLVIALAIKK